MRKEEIMLFIKDSVKENQLTYDDFEKIFWFANQKEKYSISDTISQMNISLVDQIIDNGKYKGSDLLLNLDDIFIDDVDTENVENKADEFESEEVIKTNISEKISQTNDMLCLLIQQGNKQAEQDLCIKNDRLVCKYANAYCKFYGHKLEYDDLKQSGMIGLIKAAKMYDRKMGTAFSTYAVIWIKQSISRAIMDTGFTIRIPVHKMEQILKVNRLDKEYAIQGLTYKERLAKISDVCECTEKDIEEVFVLRDEFLSLSSLDVPIDENQTTLLKELIEDKNSVLPEEAMMEQALKEDLNAAMYVLKERERDVIELRFGLKDGIPRTLEDIGKQMGVTRERIRQIEEKALRKLNNPKRSKKLADYLE